MRETRKACKRLVASIIAICGGVEPSSHGYTSTCVTGPLSKKYEVAVQRGSMTLQTAIGRRPNFNTKPSAKPARVSSLRQRNQQRCLKRLPSPPLRNSRRPHCHQRCQDVYKGRGGLIAPVFLFAQLAIPKALHAQPIQGEALGSGLVRKVQTEQQRETFSHSQKPR